MRACEGDATSEAGRTSFWLGGLVRSFASAQAAPNLQNQHSDNVRPKSSASLTGWANARIPALSIWIKHEALSAPSAAVPNEITSDP